MPKAEHRGPGTSASKHFLSTSSSRPAQPRTVANKAAAAAESLTVRVILSDADEVSEQSQCETRLQSSAVDWIIDRALFGRLPRFSTFPDRRVQFAQPTAEDRDS